MQSTTQTYTKLLRNLSRGEYSKEPTCLINDQPAFSAGTPWPSCLNTHLSAKYQKVLTNWPKEHLLTIHFYFLTRNSNHWTQNLAILTRQNVWLFQKFTKSKHHSKTQLWKVTGTKGGTESIHSFVTFLALMAWERAMYSCSIAPSSQTICGKWSLRSIRWLDVAF